MSSSVRFRLNGRDVDLATSDRRTLLWVLRGDLGLTGTKYGCGAGLCGACTVLVDGVAVRSCQTSISEIAGRSVVTIEGLARGEELHPVQRAFLDRGGFQCGFCTSGMILTACALLAKNPHPSRGEIVAGLDENLCRCGAHRRIIAAVEDASRAGGGKS